MELHKFLLYNEHGDSIYMTLHSNTSQDKLSPYSAGLRAGR
jgi:hypothetical protein